MTDDHLTSQQGYHPSIEQGLSSSPQYCFQNRNEYPLPTADIHWPPVHACGLPGLYQQGLIPRSRYIPSRPASTVEAMAEREFQVLANRQAMHSQGCSLDQNNIEFPAGLQPCLTSAEGVDGFRPTSNWVVYQQTAADQFRPLTPHFQSQFAFESANQHHGLPKVVKAPTWSSRDATALDDASCLSDEMTIDSQAEENTEPVTYARLIYQALRSAPGHRMVLHDIYQWFKTNSDRAKSGDSKGWQNSVRHNLSMNEAFVKIPLERHNGRTIKGKFIWGLTEEAFRYGVEPTTRFRRPESKSRSQTRRSRPYHNRLIKIENKGIRRSLRTKASAPESPAAETQSEFSSVPDLYPDDPSAAASFTSISSGDEQARTPYCSSVLPIDDNMGGSLSNAAFHADYFPSVFSCPDLQMIGQSGSSYPTHINV